jgi:acetate kinase
MNHPPVLVVNAGSSSLKVKLLPHNLSLLVERIGGDTQIKAGFTTSVRSDGIGDHEGAFKLCLTALAEQVPLASIVAVGHRVVHGGERYTRPTRLTPPIIAQIEALSPLAPLHNPPNLAGIRAALQLLPEVPQVAVFDTAFHSTAPAWAYLYGLPRRYYSEAGVRRYGFHGTSHDYVTRQAAQLLNRPRSELRLISLHLGNGASAAAVQFGHSVDTSMGFTPLEGLLMGTRSGDIDPGLLVYLLRGGMSVDELDQLLNKRSGLLGLSGVSNDMRDVRRAAAAGDQAASDAIAVFSYRIRKIVGAYAAAMGGLDGVIFTAGIGENDPELRAQALEGLEFLGVALDPDRNARGERLISRAGAGVAVMVIPTDEERMIAEATLEALASV